MVPKRIVVPLDGSPLAETAARIALPLADRIGAAVVLLTATEDDDPEASRSYLDGFAALVGESRIERVIATDSKAVDAIEQTVSAQPDSIICMTTHGRGRLRWAVAGSVAEEVIRDSAGPMLLVGPRGEPTWSHPKGRVLVCIDGTDAGEAATRQACDWASTLDLDVGLVFVGHPLDVEDAVHSDHLFAPLEEIVRTAGLPVRRHLVRSSFVAGVLTDLADEPETTMLVMAAHRHSEVARVALGSVVMGVLNSSSCPVLVIPPGQE
jgi:nucleotide-binding universal stress UspA family protein